MVTIVSLLPLTAGILGALLLVVASVPSSRSRTGGRSFLLLIACSAAWSLGYFVHLNWNPFPDAALARADSWVYLLLWVMALGASGAPTYWFLFAAATAHRRFWTQGIGLLIAHLPMIYTIAVAVSNPWHHLFMRPVGADAFKPGPLAPPHYIFTFVLIGAGLWLLVSHALAPRTASARRQALILGSTSSLLIVAGIAWGTRSLTHLPLPVNPTPVLFPLLEVVLAYQIVHKGLGRIVPLTTLSSVMDSAETSLAYLDPSFRFEAVNPSFLARVGMTEADLLGRRCTDVFPDEFRGVLFARASTTRLPVEGNAEPAWAGPGKDKAYWTWSLRPSLDESGEPQGYTLTVTDVTESVRERELHRTLNELDSRVHAGFGSEATLREVVTEACHALDCDWASILLSEEHEWRILRDCTEPCATWTYFEEGALPHIDLAVESESLVLLDDALHDDRVDHAVMEKLGVFSALVVPLVTTVGLVGAISFESTRSGHDLSPAQFEFARRLGSAVSMALEYARLHEHEALLGEMLRDAMRQAPGRVIDLDSRRGGPAA